MNRTIKFRAWDVDEKRMLIYPTMQYPWPTEGGKYIYLQFTGLKDKNGKDIYEGDLCVFSKDALVPPPLTVQFERGAFALDGKILLANCHAPEFEIEVIGNIYESPQLLPNAKVASKTNE